MGTTIKFTFNGVDYTLEFTRETVKRLESEGFVPGEITSKPMTILPQLFRGAFYKHHRREKPEVIDAIFKKLPDKELLIETLAKMYNEPFTELFDEPDDEEGNVKWEVGKK